MKKREISSCFFYEACAGLTSLGVIGTSGNVDSYCRLVTYYPGVVSGRNIDNVSRTDV